MEESHVGKSKHKVIIYSTPSCHFCVKVKNFLDEKGVTYDDIDVSKDRDKQQEMIEKSGQMGVPVIDIDGKIIIGWDKDRIVESLGIEA